MCTQESCVPTIIFATSPKCPVTRINYDVYGIPLDLNVALGRDVLFDPLPSSKFSAFFSKAPIRLGFKLKKRPPYPQRFVKGDKMGRILGITV